MLFFIATILAAFTVLAVQELTLTESRSFRPLHPEPAKRTRRSARGVIAKLSSPAYSPLPAGNHLVIKLPTRVNPASLAGGLSAPANA